MTQLTRRDALFVTAAVAAIAPMTHQAEAADAPETILVVPQSDPISDGLAIPVGVHIPAAWLKAKLGDFGKLTSVAVALCRSDDTPESFKTFATFNLSNNALDGANAGGDIEFSTRIKQVVEADKSPLKFKLKATVTANFTTDPKTKTVDGQPQVLEVAHSECAPASVDLLRLSVQPSRVTKDKDIDLKAVVPQPVASKKGDKRTLKTVSCGFTPGTVPDPAKRVDCVKVDVADDTLLADEVFMGFRIRPGVSGLIDLQWMYGDKTIIGGSLTTTVESS